MPAEDYEPIVIPVIFHVLNYVNKPGIASITITGETIRKNIARMNDVFNGKVSSDPNGGNAKITFRAAEYNDNGILLEEPGLHIYEMPDSTFTKDEEFRAFVFRRQSLVYDYKNFLNIWLINNPNGAASLVSVPSVIDDPENPIPGLSAEALPDDFPKTATDIGFFVNVSQFLNPFQSSDYFEISTPMARYLGLMTTQASKFNGGNLVNGDTDYCPDTFYYWNDNQIGRAHV